eukprot:3842223-Prymnesium_polylepis.1
MGAVRRGMLARHVWRTRSGRNTGGVIKDEGPERAGGLVDGGRGWMADVATPCGRGESVRGAARGWPS